MTTPQVQEMTPQQVEELNPLQLEEVITQLRGMTRQQREVIMRELRPQTSEVFTPRMDETTLQILENWFMARQYAVAILSLLLPLVVRFYEGAEIRISIYVWICFALVYAWLIKNRILSVYASYQRNAPLFYSVLSGAACFLTCIVAFYCYRQSQNLTIIRILQLCMSAILGSMLETVLLYNLRVNGVTRNGMKLWTTVQFIR